MFADRYKGKRVLITGSTGFKGSWLHLWLNRLGADVLGFGLPMTDEFCHEALLKLSSATLDIRQPDAVLKTIHDFQPDIVFHLAAQPLVRLSYQHPVETFHTNVMGTVHVLDAVRQTPSVRAVVVISSDKCYENREQLRGYTEGDPMGGFDPYSASKGCTELVVSSFRNSFFPTDGFGTTHHTLLASARAGNVIGGGDWAADRLVPDIMKATAKGLTVDIRHPNAVRPWQHVLEPLSGYLLLGQRLLEGDASCAGPWNFGPDSSGVLTVEDTVKGLQKEWEAISYRLNCPLQAPHEATLLTLDCSKAMQQLGWHCVWTPQQTFAKTAGWYRDFYQSAVCSSLQNLDDYLNDASRQQLPWTT